MVDSVQRNASAEGEVPRLRRDVSEQGSLGTKYKEWSYGKVHGQMPSFDFGKDEAASLEDVAQMHASECWRSAVEIIVEHVSDQLLVLATLAGL